MFNLVPGLFAITLLMLVSVAGLVMVQRLVPLELRKVSRWHRSREGEVEVQLANEQVLEVSVGAPIS